MFSVNDFLLDDRKFDSKMNGSNVLGWTIQDLEKFCIRERIPSSIINAIRMEKLDGKSFLVLNERDLYCLESKYNILLGDLKRFSLVVNRIQQQNRNCLIYLGILDNQNNLITNLLSNTSSTVNHHGYANSHQHLISDGPSYQDIDRISPANSVDGSSSGKRFATCIRPEFFKTTVSLGKSKIEKLFELFLICELFTHSFH